MDIRRSDAPDIGPKPRENTFEFPHREQTLIFISVFAATLLAYDKAALASLECTSLKKGEELTFRYVNESSGKAYNLQFTTLKKFGTNQSKERIEDPFIEGIRQKDSQTDGVNYFIFNQPAFNDFIKKDSVRSRDRLGLTWSSMAQMKPQDVLLMSGEMTDWNVRNQPLIDPKNQGFNPFLFFKINLTPLDLVDEGVCRQFSSKSKIFARKLIEFSGSPYLQNLAVDEIVADNHSWLVFYEFVIENDTPTIRMVYYDTFYPWGSASHKVSLKTLEAFIPPYQSAAATLKSKFFDSFSDDEKREALKYVFLLQEKGAPNFSLLEDHLELTKNVVSDLLLNGAEDRAWKIFLDTHQFIKQIRSQGIDYRNNADISRKIGIFYSWFIEKQKDEKRASEAQEFLNEIDQ